MTEAFRTVLREHFFHEDLFVCVFLMLCIVSGTVRAILSLFW